jgi:uncharacterized protein YukE
MTTSTDTRLGGDPASIRAVAAWFRDTLAPRVQDATAAAAHIRRARLEAWDDFAGRAFAARLAAGHMKMEAFAEAIRRRARLLDEIADVLEHAEAQMAEADRLADLAHLKNEGGWIWAPTPGESIDGQPENNTPEALDDYYVSRLDAYDRIEELVEDAYTKIQEKLVGDQSYDWNELTFHAGDFVKENAAELVHRHQGEQSGAVALVLTRRPEPTLLLTGARPYGLTARVLTVGGPLLTLTGAAYAYYSGDPPQRILLTTGVGFAAGGVAAWALPAIFTSLPGWAVALGATAFTVLASEGAGWAYDDNRTARDKLLDATPSLDPGAQELPG